MADDVDEAMGGGGGSAEEIDRRRLRAEALAEARAEVAEQAARVAEQAARVAAELDAERAGRAAEQAQLLQTQRERDAERAGRAAERAETNRFVSRLSDQDGFASMMSFIENWDRIPRDAHARQKAIDAFVRDVQNKYHELPKMRVAGSSPRSASFRRFDISRLTGDDELRFAHGTFNDARLKEFLADALFGGEVTELDATQVGYHSNKIRQ